MTLNTVRNLCIKSLLYFPANLASEHADKVVQHELRQQKLLKERQDAFGEAFQHDVQHYKLSGSLPSKYKMSVLHISVQQRVIFFLFFAQSE